MTNAETQPSTAVDRLDRIDTKLDRLLERSSSMPTVNGLGGMVAMVLIVALTFIGAVISTIVLGVL